MGDMHRHKHKHTHTHILVYIIYLMVEQAQKCIQTCVNNVRMREWMSVLCGRRQWYMHFYVAIESVRSKAHIHTGTRNTINSLNSTTAVTCFCYIFTPKKKLTSLWNNTDNFYPITVTQHPPHLKYNRINDISNFLCCWFSLIVITKDREKLLVVLQFFFFWLYLFADRQ